MIKLSLIAVLLLVLPQDPAKISVTTKDGRSDRVQVISREGERVKLKTFIMGGTVTLKRKLADFTPASVFRIEEQLAQAKTFEQHFALAKQAGELRLLGPAGTHAREAIEAAGGKKDSPQALQVRKWAGNTLESMCNDAVSEGNLKMAQHYLKLLSSRLPEQRTEAQLDQLAQSVAGLKTKIRSDKKAKRQAQLDERTRKDIERRLAPIQKNVVKGDKLKRDAIAKSRSTSASTGLAERSIKAYKSAWKALESLVKKYPDDNHLQGEASSISAHIHDSAIASALHAASMLTVQSDYKGAMEWATKVLAFDPDNAEAKEMRRTITIAQAAAGSRWGWGWSPAGTVGGSVTGGRGGGARRR